MTSRNSERKTAKTQTLEELSPSPNNEAAKDWQEEWLKFPTVSLDAEGGWHYWDVPPDTHIYATDWKVGEALARDTVAQMQQFWAGSSVLRRILRQIDLNSLVAQGFMTRIEDMLTNPPVFLEALEPGSVKAKLSGELPIPGWSLPAEEQVEGSK